MLSGFSRGGKVRLAVILSSLAFGIIHMIPQQVFNATLLGIVLGMICIRTRSLLPGIVFHLLHNSLMILRGTNAKVVPHDGIWNWLFRYSEGDGGLRYQPALLCLASLAAIGLLHRLTRQVEDTETPDSTVVEAAGEPDRKAQSMQEAEVAAGHHTPVGVS
jgi:sodium transport system permease protein